MIKTISSFALPRLSAGALFTFSASLLSAGCPADTGDTTATGTETETETGTDTDTGTDTAGPTTSHVDPTDTGGPTTLTTTTETTAEPETTIGPTTETTSTTEATTTTGETTAVDTTTGETTAVDTTTGDTTTTTGAVETTTTGDTTTDTTTGDTTTGGPIMPEDCQELPLLGIELLSQQEFQLESAMPVPWIRSPSTQDSITGDPALFDLLRILFDGDLAVGVHALDPDPNHAIPNNIQSYLPVSSSAVVYQEDLEANVYKKVFVAVSGELEIVEMVSPHQTQGVVRYVELREMVKNGDLLEPVEGGACWWIDEAEYDVRRPNGCSPFTDDACPADQYCMPVNAIGTDGVCVTGGAKKEGEGCTLVDPNGWDSDCESGLRCVDFGNGDECGKVCDVLSDAPGCPAGTHCGGGYNLCLPEATLQMSGIDPAPLGEPCVDTPTALYCGGEGRPGHCYDDDGQGSKCLPWVSAPSQCPAEQTSGYVAYKGGIDRSTLWCLTP
ncbi:hypothetical protein [Nannocystis punicea]|uniref:Uncharacterized protein n=1 Tax=Nannocystis punicea TaxID=2995304 RepID=A0ABY7GS75_9BACT|nr:hypothetical protein [Nannocystis poenicansa]WAS89811.1 hypothetical protein O0S08_26770 [Nannocystis poenicansa]